MGTEREREHANKSVRHHGKSAGSRTFFLTSPVSKDASVNSLVNELTKLPKE